MNKHIIILLFLFSLIFVSPVSALNEDDFGVACIVPSDKVERFMQRFAKASAQWDNKTARESVDSSEPIALTDKINREECEKLWQEMDEMLAMEKRTEHGEFFKYDAGFYRFGPYYTVVLTENIVDPDRKDIHPLDKVSTGAQASVTLFNMDFQRLGAYGYRGNSFDYHPKLQLRK